MLKGKLTPIGLITALNIGVISAPALAADTVGAASNVGAGDIIVTASRRQERITDVPFAITAIGQQEILDRGAVDIRDLQYTVPGLNIQELAPGAAKTQLRGINPGSGTGLPIVGIYVDDVGISIDQQQREGGFPLVDLARIEVLRGPQGTLYGQGSEAGTIRYITRDPNLTEMGGYVEGNVYSQEQGDIGYRFNGAIGIPLVKNVAGLRIAGGYDHLAGWVDYPALNRQNANVTKRVFVRPKLLFKPSDKLSISLLYQYYKQTTDTDNVSSLADRGIRNKVVLVPSSDELHLANGILDYDFGPATLTSSTGYLNRQLDFRGAGSFGPAGYLQYLDHYTQFTQEVRLSSNSSGPFKYTVGGWYRRFTSHVDRSLIVNGNVLGVARLVGNDPVNSRSYAFFGDGTYSVTGKLDLSLGGRYYHDDRSSGSTIPAAVTRNASFHSFSPKATLRYKWTDDASSYFTASKGFRSGGFNAASALIQNYGPESLWNYEVGTKVSLFEGRLFLDAAVFYLDYSNRQSQSLYQLPGSTTVFLTETTNVGAASGPGVEFSGTARLGGGVMLDVTAGYTDVTADKSNAEVFQGERFSLVPAFNGSVSLNQRFPLNDLLKGMWRIDYQHASSYASIFRGAGPGGTVATLENFRTPPQDYLNLRIGIEKGDLGLYADVTNLTNENAPLFANSPVVVSGEAVIARPRSYGLTLRWNFDR